MRRLEPMKETVNIRLRPEIVEALDSVCDRLKLERSENARRALREGLKTFENVELSGSRSDDKSVDGIFSLSEGGGGCDGAETWGNKRQRLEADHKRELKRLSDLAFIFLNAANSDQVQAENLLDDCVALLLEGGVLLSTWRYRIVLNHIREGL